MDALFFEEKVPRICVALTSRDRTSLLESCRKAAAAGAEILEWRSDLYAGDDAAEMLEELAHASRLPLIATYRSKAEGGETDRECPRTAEEIFQLLKSLLACGAADWIDVELALPFQKELVLAAHQQDQGVIMSRHYFHETPNDAVLQKDFEAMQAYGADVLKLAVMPQNLPDVLRFMDFSAKFAETASEPLITMSMGKLGTLTRLGGAVTGSVMTFAALDAAEASAPGQLPLAFVREFLKNYRKF